MEEGIGLCMVIVFGWSMQGASRGGEWRGLTRSSSPQVGTEAGRLKALWEKRLSGEVPELS